MPGIVYTCIAKIAGGKSCPDPVKLGTPYCLFHAEYLEQLQIQNATLGQLVSAGVDSAEPMRQALMEQVSLVKELRLEVENLSRQLRAERAPCVSCGAFVRKEPDHDYCSNCAEGLATLVVMLRKESLELLRDTFKEKIYFRSDVMNMVEAAIEEKHVYYRNNPPPARPLPRLIYEPKKEEI